MGRLEQEKALIEHKIQELLAFEREYRLKLKTYIEAQLRDLETAAQTSTQTAIGE
jgi:CRISPR/Cas system-associated endonuclease Cas1